MRIRRWLKRDKSQRNKNKKGQVWVETVIYLLIAFVMMGLVLAFTKPKIEEMRDRAIIEQSMEVIKEIDNSILTIGSTGNKRLIEISIKKGFFTINSTKDLIQFEMDTDYSYGETNQAVFIGNIKTNTTGRGEAKRILLERNLTESYDFTFDGLGDIDKMLTKAPTPYRLSIENKGVLNDKIVIDFKLE